MPKEQKPKAVLNVRTTDGNMDIWESEKWDKFRIDESERLIIEQNGETVGIYPMDSVISIRKYEKA